MFSSLILQYLSVVTNAFQLLLISGAWIITGGTHTGVMEFVGEAVRDYILATGSSGQNVVAIGIATWGVIDNNKALISSDVSS